jgi:hypothetical protein
MPNNNTTRISWVTDWNTHNQNVLHGTARHTPTLTRTLSTAMRYGACATTCLLATCVSTAAVIYALIPLSPATESRIYVGSTITPLAERLSGHLSASRDVFASHTAPAGHREFYKWIYASSGGTLPINPYLFCAVILQRLPTDIALGALHYCEQRWVHILNARHPHGFNNRKANTLGKNNSTYDIYLPVQLKELGVDIFNNTAVEHTLRNQLHRSDLIHVIPFIKHLVVVRQCRPTLVELQQVASSKLDAAIHILSHISTQKLGATEIMHTNLLHLLITASNQPVLTITPAFSFRNLVFIDSTFRYLAEKINLNKILRAPEVMARWSPPANPATYPGEVAPPCLVFKPAPPISLQFCQNKRLASNISFDQVCPHIPITTWQHLDLHTPCTCHTRPHAINHDLGHILTCEHQHMVDSPKLLTLLKRGPRFRCPLLLHDGDSDIDAFLQNISSTLTEYLAKRKISTHTQPWASQWIQQILQAVEHASQEQHDLDFTSEKTIAEQYNLDADAIQELKQLRKHYAIITVDKAADLFAIVCKNHLYKSILKDLTNSDFFHILPTTHTSQHTIQQQLQDLHSFNLQPKHTEQHKLGHYMAIAKLHKNPPTFRFITSSKNCTTERMNVYLTRFLTAVQAFADMLFHDTLCALNLEFYSADTRHRPKSWILQSSYEVVDIIKHFNRHSITFESANRNMTITTADFERLYTFMKQDDCIDRVCSLVAAFMDTKPHCVLKVYFNKDGGTKWLTPPQQRDNVQPGLYGKDKGGEYYVFDLNTFTAIFTWMMNNNYFTFGGRVFHQTRGIAMGSNASVLIANLYLYTYELEFIKQHWFRPPHRLDHPQNKESHKKARRLLRRCMHSARYIDDGLFVGNKNIDLLIKQPAPDTPFTGYTTPGYFSLPTPGTFIRGIYPHYLNITHSTSENEHFMDLRFSVQREPHTLLPSFTTHIFDKRDFDLRSLPTKTYVHPHSDTAIWCKLGIILSQVQRFARLSTDAGDFTFHTARLLYRMLQAGYSGRELAIYLRRAVKRAAKIYAIADPRALEKRVNDFLAEPALLLMPLT